MYLLTGVNTMQAREFSHRVERFRMGLVVAVVESFPSLSKFLPRAIVWKSLFVAAARPLSSLPRVAAEI
jgi:hypothetical protein